MIKKKLISIVIPAYNEEEVIPELVKRLKATMDSLPRYDFEVIIIENGSHDSSLELLTQTNKRDKRFKTLSFSRNFGSEGANCAGSKYAKGDAVVYMNADLQDPPEMIPKFVEQWEGGYDIIYGVIKKRKGVSSTRKIVSWLFYKVLFFMTNHAIPKNTSDFRLIDKKVNDVLNQMLERHRFMRGLTVWTGFKQLGVPYERPGRFAGEPKANYLSLIEFAINGILSFSYYPLSLSTLAGFMTSLASFALLIFQLGLFLLYGRVVPGLATIVTLILFLFGMLFLILGIIGLYMARIYDEVKKRPSYIVAEEIGFE